MVLITCGETFHIVLINLAAKMIFFFFLNLFANLLTEGGIRAFCGAIFTCSKFASVLDILACWWSVGR